MKEKHNKLDQFELRTLKRAKSQGKEWAKIFPDHIINKKFLS